MTVDLHVMSIAASVAVFIGAFMVGWSFRGRAMNMASDNGCAHPNATWGDWYESVQGVTHWIEAKDKTCPNCGVVDRQTRNGRAV